MFWINVIIVSNKNSPKRWIIWIVEKSKNGNGAVSGRISAGFGSSGFGFGDCFSPTVFGFGYPKISGFGVDFQFYLRITFGASNKSSPPAAHQQPINNPKYIMLSATLNPSPGHPPHLTAHSRTGLAARRSPLSLSLTCPHLDTLPPHDRVRALASPPDGRRPPLGLALAAGRRDAA